MSAPVRVREKYPQVSTSLFTSARSQSPRRALLSAVKSDGSLLRPMVSSILRSSLEQDYQREYAYLQRARQKIIQDVELEPADHLHRDYQHKNASCDLSRAGIAYEL